MFERSLAPRQAFNWESHRERWWARLGGRAEALAGLGVTVVWLPPPTDSVSPEGYLPRDLYCLDSAYGSARELRRRALHQLACQTLNPR